MIRLGLCCKFIEAPIHFRTTTASYLLRIRSRGENSLDYVAIIVKNNIESLEKAIKYCIKNSIKSFRIGSDFMPVATHPKVGYTLDDLSNSHDLKSKIKICGEMAYQAGIRLTFHPSQFVILSSSDNEIISKSINDLEYHADLAERLGADVINIHGGGAYGDKNKALENFKKNFSALSKRVKTRLTIENDDRVYTPKDLIPVCSELKIPFVYDVHHHRCLPDGWSIERATQETLATWNREPLFHISSPLEDWNSPKSRRHHNYINIADMPPFWKNINPLTIEVEAKAKEKAVLRLYKQLKDENWNL